MRTPKHSTNMELNPKQKAIGSGITFPLEVKNGGVYPVLGDIKLIEDNINSLLLYPVGFRYRQEEYGTAVESYLEEPNTQALAFLIKAQLTGAIGAYESRIILKSILTKTFEAAMAVRLTYQLSDTPLQAYIDFALARNI